MYKKNSAGPAGQSKDRPAGPAGQSRMSFPRLMRESLTKDYRVEPDNDTSRLAMTGA